MKETIKLDGLMDEPIWSTVPEYTDFRVMPKNGGGLAECQTFFKILPLADRIIIGVKCLEPNMDYMLEHHARHGMYTSEHVEILISPAGSTTSFYQFFVRYGGEKICYFYEEGGNIKPDPYAPDWKTATYTGEDFWSAEVEIPLSSFYMTATNRWTDKWRFNMGRLRHKPNVGLTSGGEEISSWNGQGFFEPQHFWVIENMPIRPAEDDVYMVTAIADMTEQTADGYKGTLTVKTSCGTDGEYTFTSDYAESAKVSLKAGEDEFTVPCFYPNTTRYFTTLCLTRVSDGKEFKRQYPVLVAYEPIKIRFTLPEYKNNFYPGQDATKIVGTAKATKPVTLTLEGPGIPKQTLTPDAEGNFHFDTPDFAEGDAYLTATMEGYETKKKISRLAPTGRMMSWISGGNLIVDGKAEFRRNIYAYSWRGGEALLRKFHGEDQYLTEHILKNTGYIQPDVLIKGLNGPGGEGLRDEPISDALKAKVDEVMEAHKDKNFTYYYIYDEPECVNISPVFLKSLYEYISEKDPYHVCSIASRACETYVDCADWFETHAYLDINVVNGERIFARPINTVGRYVDDIAKLNRPDKCIGFMPTCFAYKYLSLLADFPTFDEMIAHCWAAMIRGAKSFWPFAFMDMNDRASVYEGNRYVYSTVEALQEFLLHGKRTTILNTSDVEAATFDLPDKKMFVLINKVPTPQTVTLPEISGTWCEFRHARDITTNTFELKPYEVIVGTSEDMSGDLPTYQEILAICENAEYKRTHNKSLLFDRVSDIVFKTSALDRGNFKLMDGVYDDLGWEDGAKPGSRPKFIEMDISKVQPTFSKIVLTGWNLEDTVIKAGKAEALEVLEFTESHDSEFKYTYVLNAPVTPDVIRFEFNQTQTEVYEIEVF